MPDGTHAATLAALDDLPRLTDDERDELDSPYVASGAPEVKPRFHEHVRGVAYEGLPEPLPCPFCGFLEFGGIVEHVCEGLRPGTNEHERTYHVQCDHCGSEGPACDSPLAAAEAWNAASSDLAKQKSAPLEGFYKFDPRAGEHDAPIPVSELIYALQSVTAVLNQEQFGLERSHEDIQQLAGLCSAANILANLIAGRMTGEDVVKKPQPRKRKPRTQVANVVPLKSA